MRYLIGSASLPSFEKIQARIPDCGMLLQPKSWRKPHGVYACDNGVYAAWIKGRGWDQQMHNDYLRMLAKISRDNLPLWVLLPDAVANWHRTVELARIYLPIIRQAGLAVAIALQDGCSFEQALEFTPECAFVAGSDRWKEDNVAPACSFFRPKGISVHVGRVNTRRRLIICQIAGADSVDGTSLNRWRNANLALIANTLRQRCLNLIRLTTKGSNELK